MIAVFLEFVATKSFLTLRAFLDVGTSNKAGSVLPAKFRISSLSRQDIWAAVKHNVELEQEIGQDE